MQKTRASSMRGSRVTMQWLLAGLLAAASGLFLNASEAQAQIYRVIDENGKVSFTDKPPADTGQISAEEVDVDESVQNTSLSSEAIEGRQPEWLKEAIEKREAEEKALQAAKPGAAEMRAWREALANAKRELREARAAQERGIIASEGDYIGKAGGGVRPSQQYFEKLRKLDQDVSDAKERVEQLKRAKPR